MKKNIILSLLLALTSMTAFPQSRIDSVALRAMQVGRVMQQERVYLHFDNTAYYLGETIWFKAYTTFGTNDKPSTLSKVLYVELVAPEGYVVETKKYKLNDNGTCYGEFELKPLFLSGYYEVRAYTRYMLNWGKDAVFSRVFPVFDKVNADSWDFKNMLDRRRGYTEKGKWKSSKLPDATLEFFPEGGNLVAGLESKVAYELRENDGLFSEEKIALYENGRKILESTPAHMGKGTFMLKPVKGAEYYAEATIKDEKGKLKKHRFKLPEIAREGVVMNIAENGDSIDITISNNLQDDTEFGFAILFRGTMGFYNKLNTAQKSISFSIARNSLPEGVNRAVLFANEKTPLAERQFFVMHDELQASGHETVKLNVTANGYHVHNLNADANEKITLKISREDGKPIPEGTDLSLTVSDAIGKQGTSYGYNMYSYLLLGSELKGYIPNAAQYFDSYNSNRKEELDLVMLTHGWTSYNWHMLTREKINDMQPIERGITLRGIFYQKRKNNKIGHYGSPVLTPQAYNLTRLDIESDSGQIITTTFRTDSTGAFMIEFDDFYGTRIAAMRPQTKFKHSNNISYQFALDRYYSPGFRLYDYWERHLGNAISKSTADSLVRINPFEYMLSSVDVVEKRKQEINERPPHSEMRFNYLDEWEYAQDVTFLDKFDTYEDEIYRHIIDNFYSTERELDDYIDSSAYEASTSGWTCRALTKIDTFETAIRYVGNIRYSNKEPIYFTVKNEYNHTLTANDVVLSAMRRHNYSWAYWVQLMVVLGEYSHDRVPQPDMEYLRGIPDAEKMTDFKEIVIRSDEKTRQQFENRNTRWTPLSRMMDNKGPIQKFYKGFLSQSYLYAGSGIDGCPNSDRFHDMIMQSYGIAYPENPNYVACLIPYNDEDRKQGIVPELAATGSSLRYTSVQGYSESKQFYSPDYSSMKPQEKDYRRTLLWIPEVTIDNGEAIVELYNNSSCRNIEVDIAGRDNSSIYSNEDGIITRLHREKQEKSTPQENRYGNRPNVDRYEMDSTLKAQCAWQHEKGLIYYNQKRYRDAISIFAELIQYRHAPSMYYIGLCYRDGTGLKVNDSLALKFFTEAARLGNAMAQYDLAVTIEKNDGDMSEAHEWYSIAAEQKEPRALLEMSHRYRDGKNVTQDSVKAMQQLGDAAKGRLPEAMFEYGKILADNGDANGIAYIDAAAELNHNEAGVFMMEHEHSAGNFKEAYRYAKMLYMAKDHRGTKRMADYYYSGKGVGRDKSIAKDLYREAAAAGNEEAAKILKEL